MNIKVISRQKAEEMFPLNGEQDIKVNIISIYSKGSTPAKIKAKGDILFLQFDDSEKVNEGGMSKEQADKIAEFVSNIRHKEYTLYVHCDAGVSRSAGVASAIMYCVNGDDSEIFDNGKYVPNMLCYRQVIKAFGKLINESEVNEKLNRNLEAWKVLNMIQ